MEKELVFLKNKQAVTDSRIVADYFDRTHNEVLKSIRRLKNDIGGLVKNPQTPMFIETTYINEQNGQSYPMFYMNRDGFSLLAMGFTGKKALQFKLAFIAAFNSMEQSLTSIVTNQIPEPLPVDIHSISRFERGKELAKLAQSARDPFMKKTLVAKAANLIAGESVFDLDDIGGTKELDTVDIDGDTFEQATISADSGEIYPPLRFAFTLGKWKRKK